MATVTITPDTPGGGTAATIHPSTTYPLLRGARLPVTQHEGTWTEPPDAEGRFRTRSRPLNPTGEGRVLVQGTTAALFRTNSNAFQSLIAQTNRYGGTLTYTPTGGTAIAYEIVEINLGEIEPDLEHSETRAVFPFTFECRPYGRLASTTVAFTGGSLSGPVDYIDLPDVPGHVDALGLLTLTDASSQDRDHIEYGLEMDGYDSGSPTDLIISKSDMNVTGLSGVSATSLSGEYSGATWRATLFTSPLAVCSTGTQTHQGRRRVRCRVWASGTGPVYVRLAWRIGDGPWERNAWVEAGIGFWAEPSLGSIYVTPGESWEGRVEAKSANNATDTVDVDVLFPMPAERWGKSSRLEKSQTTNVLSAYDTFLHAGGPLTGEAMPVGGVWAGAGDADGYVVEAAGDFVSRTAVSDASTGYQTGHFARAGSTDYTAVRVSVESAASSTLGTSRMGVIARYTDVNNWIGAFWATAGANIAALEVVKRVASTTTVLWTNRPYSFIADQWRTIALEVDTAGRWALYVSGLGGGSTFAAPTASGQDSILTTTLATGDVGMYDWQYTSTAVGRYAQNFMVSAPAASESYTAMFSGQSMRFTHDGAERENSAGTTWGMAPEFVGEHLLIPPAGREDRVSRIAVLARRHDIDAGSSSDGLSDSLTATLTVTPRVLLTGS